MKNNRLFANDVHIVNSENISIACIPITHYDVIIGILYMEKYDSSFDSSTLQFIKGFIPAIISKAIGNKGF